MVATLECLTTPSMFAEMERELPDLPCEHDVDNPRLIHKADIIDRIEEAMDKLDLDIRVWAIVAAVVLPEEFGPDAEDEPTDHLPGSQEKIEVMRRRFAKRRPLFHPRDARRE